jgi:DNA-binding transcriptional regulator YiaG
MSEDQAPYTNASNTKESVKLRDKKKAMIVTIEDEARLKSIAEKAAALRKGKKMSSEEFAQHSGIPRNSYYRFEKSAATGDNFTISLLLKVISGLGMTPSEFFKDIH